MSASVECECASVNAHARVKGSSKDAVTCGKASPLLLRNSTELTRLLSFCDCIRLRLSTMPGIDSPARISINVGSVDPSDNDFDTSVTLITREKFD